MHSSFLFKRFVACILSENTYFELQPRNKKKVEAREERPILSRSSALHGAILRKQYDMPMD